MAAYVDAPSPCFHWQIPFYRFAKAARKVTNMASIRSLQDSPRFRTKVGGLGDGRRALSGQKPHKNRILLAGDIPENTRNDVFSVLFWVSRILASPWRLKTATEFHN